MSKMGISTYQSYCGAQIFDAIGLASDFVDEYFSGTATTIEGVGLDEIATETVAPPHATPSATIRCCATRSKSAASMSTGMRGEDHVWSPRRGRDAAARRARQRRRGPYRDYAEP